MTPLVERPCGRAGGRSAALDTGMKEEPLAGKGGGGLEANPLTLSEEGRAAVVECALPEVGGLDWEGESIVVRGVMVVLRALEAPGSCRVDVLDADEVELALELAEPTALRVFPATASASSADRRVISEEGAAASWRGLRDAVVVVVVVVVAVSSRGSL